MYVTDTANNRVQKFDPAGDYISQFGNTGTGNGQFQLPAAVAVDPSTGDVYVIDEGNNRVEELDAAGDYISQFGTKGAGNDQFNHPLGVAVDPASGNVYVIDSNHDRVEKFDAASNYISQFGTEGTGNRRTGRSGRSTKPPARSPTGRIPGSPAPTASPTTPPR